MTLSLDRLRELRVLFSDIPVDVARETLAALDDLIRRIEADRWKPASDPPDTDRPVLVKLSCGQMCIANYYGGGFQWWLPIGLQDRAVTHWRELPETPDAL